jgi:hypothetical protein
MRFARPWAMGRKVSDEWTVPLRATHQRSLHTMGEKEKWWKERQTDPVTHSMRLWQEIRKQTMPVAKAKDLILPLLG